MAWRFTAGYLVFGAVVVYLLFQFWLAHHGLRIAHGFIPEYWGRYFLVVGITEEFVFRGYFLNVLLRENQFDDGQRFASYRFRQPTHPPLPDNRTSNEPDQLDRQPDLCFCAGSPIRLVIRLQSLTMARYRYPYDLGHFGYPLCLNSKKCVQDR